ncbi:MAG: glycine/betaine/sarcosine/D-proline family reductase selenoprotein B [Acidimicrobiia bacterium]|nr:glycine/betaine/sarcosine/D-proline family reductase selenoprotein B [Acidimicrobiia bacterium]
MPEEPFAGGSNKPMDGVDPALRSHISYIDRSREYYRAKGFVTPYRWIKHRSSPFTPLRRPLSEATVGVVTTSFPPEAVEGRSKAVMASPSSPTPDVMYTSDLFWHKKATHTDDVESFLPLKTLRTLRAQGRIGALSDRYYSIPTRHSHRQTKGFAAEIVALCREDGLDAVLLVPL